MKNYKVYKIYRYYIPALDAYYIGQTINFKRCTPSHYKNNPLFYTALKNYDYEFDVLACCDTKEDADILENYYIKKYDSINKGFNSYINQTPSVLFRDILENQIVINKVEAAERRQNRTFKVIY